MYKPVIIILAALLLAAAYNNGEIQQYINEMMFHFDRVY